MARHTRWTRQGIRRLIGSLPAIVVAVCLFGGTIEQVNAQEGVLSPYRLIETSSHESIRQAIPWPDGVAFPEANAGWRDQLLSWYQERAWYTAGIDSVDSDSRIVWVNPGTLVRIGSISATADAEEGVSETLTTQLGEPATKVRIEDIVGSLLEQASRRGHLSAQARVVITGLDEDGLHLQFDVVNGPLTRLDDVVLEGDPRTQSAAVRSVLGLRHGQSLAGVNLEGVRTALTSAGLHEQVSEPRYELVSDSAAVLIIPVLPLPPGRFDLVVGALPGQAGGPARIIGSGHLLLSNAFGRGRRVEARINRLPDQASSAMLAFESPAPSGWPFQISLGLQGHQQDSTWNQSRLNSRVMYRLDTATWIGASFSAERTRAGFSGSDFIGDVQAVPRASSRLGGLTMKVNRLDHPRYPRNGLSLETTLETGIRSSRSMEIVDTDTLSVERSERRERLAMDLDLFAMNGERLGWAAGIDAAAIRAGRPDVSELLFLGGASSLRGYDENRFSGTAVVRAFIEGRWYVDRASWGFVFMDAGWVAIDADFETGLPSILQESEGFHPGYGFGFVFSSALGPLSLSYALNPEVTFSEGRVHVGLSFGL